MSLLEALRHMITRGVVKTTDATSGIQSVGVETYADDSDDAEHFQPYGLSAHAPAGAEAIIVHVGGSEDHAVAVVIDDRASRPTDLQAGEVALYSQHGQKIWLKADGSIYIAPADGMRVVVGTLDAGAASALAIAQKVEIELEALRVTLNTHTHAVAGITAGPAQVVSAVALPQASPVGDTASGSVDGAL